MTVNAPTDIQIYCNHMVGVRDRLNTVKAILSGHITTGVEGVNTELIFLQLRKTLELIAFASLVANKSAYSSVHEKFAEHWRAKTMLNEIEKLNHDFYPMALDAPRETVPGMKHFDRPLDGFMTKADFVLLYNVSSDVLHTRNPYSAKDPTIQIGFSVPQWIARIQRC